MEYTIYKPSADLAHLVKYYVYNQADKSLVNFRLKTISTGNVEIYFYLDQTIGIRINNNIKTNLRHAYILGNEGYVNSTALELRTSYKAFVVVLAPGALSLIFGFPEYILFNKIYSLEDIYKANLIRILKEQIINASDDYNRIFYFEQFLRKNCSPVKQRFPGGLIDFLHYNCAGDNIMDICYQYGIGRRSLERYLKITTGLTPHEYLHIKRINNVFMQLSLGASCGWANFAIQMGYFDQSHFIKDFKSLVGITPQNFYQTIPEYIYCQKHSNRTFIPLLD